MRNAIITIGLIISSFNCAFASENMLDENSSKHISLVTFNIDTNILRTEEGYARDSHPEWRVGARMPMILKSLGILIQTVNPDLIHIQEGRKFETKFGDEVNSIDPLLAFLSDQGYRASAAGYNPTDRAFSYISAVREGKLKIESHESRYFTKTPSTPTDHTDHQARLPAIKAHNFGEEWERSAYLTKFSDQFGHNIYAINCHLGITLEHRLKASELLNKWAEDIIAADPSGRIIMTGDFNSFPDWGGADQIRLIKDGGVMKHGTESLHLLGQPHQEICSSFFAFPYDFGADEKRLNLTQALVALEPKVRKVKIAEVFKAECKALGGHLDHVFYSGFTDVCSFLSPTPVFGIPADGYTEESVKSYILDHHEEGPAFASDHQPVVSILKFE